MDRSNPVCYLDQIRLRDGRDKLINYFSDLLLKDMVEASNLINSESIKFASLFLLRESIEATELPNNLNSRNKLALEITDEILLGETKISVTEYLTSDYIQMTNSVLRWMLETGLADDGLNDDFDEVLDGTSALLLEIYRDKSILPDIADLIFIRYKKGTLIHNLVWAFFEAQDPQSLALIAERLRSKDSKDVELASELLSFIPGITMYRNTDKHKQYLYFLNWIEENGLYLEFTGQSFQQSCNPAPFIVNLDAKYLCKSFFSNNAKPVKYLDEEECQLLNHFKKLDINSKQLLSTYSFRLYHSNPHLWNTWIHYSIQEQLRIAAGGAV
jgi:hypothetical protein